MSGLHPVPAFNNWLSAISSSYAGGGGGSSQFNIITALQQDASLKAAILGDRAAILQPLCQPPSYKSVNDWLLSKKSRKTKSPAPVFEPSETLKETVSESSTLQLSGATVGESAENFVSPNAVINTSRDTSSVCAEKTALKELHLSPEIPRVLGSNSATSSPASSLAKQDTLDSNPSESRRQAVTSTPVSGTTHSVSRRKILVDDEGKASLAGEKQAVLSKKPLPSRRTSTVCEVPQASFHGYCLQYL